MRLGGPVFETADTPGEWAGQVAARGYRAAYCPVGLDADEQTIAAYEQAAREADLVIAEVGAWSNPLSDDPDDRKAALDKCCRALWLADRIGAGCCVNIAGSRGRQWDGPHPDNLTDETFDRIVESVRSIIDAVKPTRTCYALETMPWAFPDSPESYALLLDAIDRPACGVHLDPVNLVNSPRCYFQNGALIRRCFELLGPRIKSCHAKDILLHGNLTVHLDEVRPGAGGLDYGVYLRELNRLHPDIPLMLEHLPNAAEYELAARHIREVALNLDLVV